MKNDNNYICKIICNVIGWGQIAILKWWPTSCHKFIWIQFQIIKHLNVSIQHHCFSVIEFIIILRPWIFTSFFFPFTLCCILNLKIWIIFLYIDMKDKVTYNTNIFHWLVSDDLKIFIIKCRCVSANQPWTLISRIFSRTFSYGMSTQQSNNLKIFTFIKNEFLRFTLLYYMFFR